jgi:hypothetical protein
MAAPVKNMRTIFPSSVTSDSGNTGTTTTTIIETPARTNASASGGVLASVATGATVSSTITMAKSFTLMKVVCTFKTRVRLYSTAAARDADATRPYTTPITVGTQHGMICDLQLDTADNLSWVMSPEAEGSNVDTGTATIYYNITNLEASTKSLSVTFTYLPEEA